MPSVLITGANRGIGLELARQYAGDGWRVLASCRDPESATELKAITGDLRVCRLDVDDPASIEGLAASLEGQPVDVLFNNAGINRRTPSIAAIDYDAWAESMVTNVFGPIRVCEAFKDNVCASERKVMAFTSSRMGSIAANAGGSIVYRSSKTALNMAVSCLAKEYGADGVIAVLFHPGHVRTDMGGPTAPITPSESSAGMRKVIAGLTAKDNGSFRNYDGATLPW